MAEEKKQLTREEKLWTMTGMTLLGVANRLGLYPNKNILKKGKEKLIKQILEAEAAQNIPEVIKEEANSKVVTVEEVSTTVIETSKKNKTKKSNLRLTALTYKGETKSIRQWAEELNMPWATLYDRVNRNNWSVEEAIEIPLGRRRPK